MYLRELRVRYRLRRVLGALPTHIRTPRDAVLTLMPLLRHEAVEVAGVLCPSTRYELLSYHELTRGTVDSTLMHPRDILKVALLSNARAIVVGHNHPSGDVSPSRDDMEVTSRIFRASELMSVEFLDHIIVSAEGTYFSFKDAGHL